MSQTRLAIQHYRLAVERSDANLVLLENVATAYSVRLSAPHARVNPSLLVGTAGILGPCIVWLCASCLLVYSTTWGLELGKDTAMKLRHKIDFKHGTSSVHNVKKTKH